ncbi:MAG: hypothetical protein FJ291_19240 [Planctomycetes bacterium]|nr:hypothetical protein [Planctomycetota bacterium]
MPHSRDASILRELAKRYAEVCRKPTYDERRGLWRRHNSLQRTRPLLYVRWLAAWHEAPESRLACEDPFLRPFENHLRQMLFQDTIGDDYVLEPWLTARASVATPPEGLWGLPIRHSARTAPRGSWKFQPTLATLDDAERLTFAHHRIDEEATARNAARLHDAVGDVLPIAIDRSPAYTGWNGDISTLLTQLRGLDQLMLDMMDNPAWLHRVLKFMSDAILTTHDEAEEMGYWTLCNHANQAMPYAAELPDPSPGPTPVARDKLWVFVAAQEYTLISPAMHDEFLLQYQLPIMSRFGLSAYGCCEDLTRKISMLRKVPNLRRIAVTPRADVARCAEQIGTDYVLSWRPNPAQMLCCGYDPALIRKVIRDGMEASRGCHVDITLKDVETVQGKPANLRRWVKLVRSITDHYT